MSEKSTRLRIQHAYGYIGLGMLNEASDELEAIPFADRFLPEVLAVRIEVQMESKHWETVVAIGRELAQRHPEFERAWIAWAFALRELEQIAEAKAVLLEAERLHPGSAVLHYNLACYDALLGELASARQRLERACKLDKDFKATAREDKDLESLWDELRA